MKKLFPLLTLGAMALSGCATIDALANIEEPAYKVIKQDGDFELREYASMIVAETTVSGSLDEASSRGFRVIADYIFGNNIASGASSNEKIAMTAPVTMTAANQSSEKIAMTAPVTMAAGDAAPDTWRMHFVMPSKYTMASLPTPKNPAVKLREVAAQRVAVNRFSVFSGEQKVADKTAQLNDWISRSNLSPSGKSQLARYNMPLTPPPLRRNEILIPVQ
ncbi:MAG: heme-binding protein [Betaproteobacteria bacterium]